MSAWSRIAEHDPAYRRYRAWVKTTGPTCAICGHSNADSVDHRIPPSTNPLIAVALALDPANWRPAHGVRGCPSCPPNPSRDKRRNGQPQRCNQSKGARLQPVSQPPIRRW